PEGHLEIWQTLEVVEAALDDEDVPGAVLEGKVPAVGRVGHRRALVLGEERRGEVDPFQASEPKLLEGMDAVAPAAEDLDDLRILRPVVGPEPAQPPEELAALLGRGLEARVGLLPGAGWGDRGAVVSGSRGHGGGSPVRDGPVSGDETAGGSRAAEPAA